MEGYIGYCVMIPYKFKVPPHATCGIEWHHRAISSANNL